MPSYITQPNYHTFDDAVVSAGKKIKKEAGKGVGREWRWRRGRRKWRKETQRKTGGKKMKGGKDGEVNEMI